MSRLISLLKGTAVPALLLSAAMTLATTFNLYILQGSVLPNIEAIRPVTAQNAQVTIALQLPPTDEGRAAATIAQYQADEIGMLYDSWLSQARAQIDAMRIQLVGWLVALVLSAITSVERFRGAENAA